MLEADVKEAFHNISGEYPYGINMEKQIFKHDGNIFGFRQDEDGKIKIRMYLGRRWYKWWFRKTWSKDLENFGEMMGYWAFKLGPPPFLW